MLRPLTLVEQVAKPLGGGDSEVVRALGTDAEVLFEVLVVDDLGASRALHPQALGNAARLLGGGGGDRLPRLLEPGHSPYFTSAGRNTVCRGSSIESAESGRPPQHRWRGNPRGRFRPPAAEWPNSGRRSAGTPRSAPLDS